jgi:hypothetical protein
MGPGALTAGSPYVHAAQEFEGLRAYYSSPFMWVHPPLLFFCYLAAAALLQTVVVGVTLARGGGITYLTEGRGRRLGSALLHLGFIVFCFVVVALQGSPAVMLPVFFVSAILLAAGSAMSFYSRG